MWQYLISRFSEASSHASIAAIAGSVAMTATSPTVQTVAMTISALSGFAGYMIPSGSANAQAAIKALGNVADAVANNSDGNKVDTKAALSSAATGVLQAAASDPKLVAKAPLLAGFNKPAG